VSVGNTNRAVAFGPPPHILLTGSSLLGNAYTAFPQTGGAWPTAGLAIYMPAAIPWRALLRKVVIYNGNAVSGNFDVGIYDTGGTRLWSSGATAQSGTSQEQVIDVSPDLLLSPGMHYVGLVSDNTTGKFFRLGLSGLVCVLLGQYTQAAAYPLPATATFAYDYSTSFVPFVGLAFEATVA